MAIAELGAFGVAMALNEVVVDHAGRLHERIDDGRTYELETAPRELRGDLSRQFGLGGNLRDRAEPVLLRTAVEEIPQQGRESRTLVHDLEIGARGEHSAFDLRAVAHDTRIGHQPRDLCRAVARDFPRIEAVERAAEILALAQDGDPGEAGLKAVEHELLVERAVVELRHAPFLVVIGDVERILLGTRTAQQAVRMLRREHRAHACGCASPGNGNRAQLGFAKRIGTPAAESRAPSASASSTRSMRRLASARPAADEPIVPTTLSPAITALPASGAAPS